MLYRKLSNIIKVYPSRCYRALSSNVEVQSIYNIDNIDNVYYSKNILCHLDTGALCNVCKGNGWTMSVKSHSNNIRKSFHNKILDKKIDDNMFALNFNFDMCIYCNGTGLI